MAQYSEWTGPAVQSSACSYATLSQYNNGAQGMNLPTAGAAAGNRISIIPTFSAPPGYNTISRGVPTCSGYSNMQRAYGSGSGGCGSQYVSRLCQ